MMRRIRAGRAREADEEEDVMSVKMQNAKGIVELEESFLPPAIDDERTCKRWYVPDTWMPYRTVGFTVYNWKAVFTPPLGRGECG